MPIWTDDPNGLSTNLPIIGKVTIGSDTSRVAKLFVEELDATNIVLDDLDINYALSVYAAGTAYTLTATSAAADFGTTDPTLVLNKAGTYLITGRVNYQLVGATFAANRTVTSKLRRTNNTAADIANSSSAIGTGVTSTITGPLDVFSLAQVIYTTTAITDSISIFADVSVIPTAGSLEMTEASIVAIRLY